MSFSDSIAKTMDHLLIFEAWNQDPPPYYLKND
jgi:hypothetical protein